MGGAPGVQHQDSLAQIDAGFLADLDIGFHDPGPLEGRSDQTLERLQVEGSTQRQRACELVVAGEPGVAIPEGRIAESVIGMCVGVDHVGDGKIGERLDALSQAPAERKAAAAVDDRDRVPPDHHARVAESSQVLARRILVGTDVHVDAFRHLHERERRDLRQRAGTKRQTGGERKRAPPAPRVCAADAPSRRLDREPAVPGRWRSTLRPCAGRSDAGTRARREPGLARLRGSLYHRGP